MLFISWPTADGSNEKPPAFTGGRLFVCCFICPGGRCDSIGLFSFSARPGNETKDGACGAPRSPRDLEPPEGRSVLKDALPGGGPIAGAPARLSARRGGCCVRGSSRSTGRSRYTRAGPLEGAYKMLRGDTLKGDPFLKGTVVLRGQGCFIGSGPDAQVVDDPRDAPIAAEQHRGSKLHRVGAEHHIFQYVFIQFDAADFTACQRGKRGRRRLPHPRQSISGWRLHRTATARQPQ